MYNIQCTLYILHGINVNTLPAQSITLIVECGVCVQQPRISVGYIKIIIIIKTITYH